MKKSDKLVEIKVTKSEKKWQPIQKSNKLVKKQKQKQKTKSKKKV